LAMGPIRGTDLTLSIYYAKNIAAASAGSNIVNLHLSANQFGSIQILEYSGLSTTAPLDVTASASGTSTSLNSGNVPTNFANELIIGAQTSASSGQYTATGSGFRPVSTVTSLSSIGVVEDQIVSSTGIYNATSSLNFSNPWIMGIATFH